jgi:hypothetical protein
MLLHKYLHKIIIPTSLLIASSSNVYANVYANLSFNEYSPFVGVDFGRSSLGLQQNYGDKIFRKNTTSYNLFAGLNFNDFFGLEVGHQRDNSRDATRTLVAGDYCPGGKVVTPTSSPLVFQTALKAKSTYLGATAQYPILEKLSIIGLVGISRASINARQTIVSIHGQPQTEKQIQDMLFARTYKKSKFVPMARIGAKCQVNKAFAVRGGITWMGTSRIRINSDQNSQPRTGTAPAPNNSIRLKNSMSYSMGIIYSP